jgi:hypothetical protein
VCVVVGAGGGGVMQAHHLTLLTLRLQWWSREGLFALEAQAAPSSAVWGCVLDWGFSSSTACRCSMCTLCVEWWPFDINSIHRAAEHVCLFTAV